MKEGIALKQAFRYFLAMKKNIFLLGVFVFSLWGAFKLFQSPERHLLKKTKHLIGLASQVETKLSFSLASKMAEINKHIHHNVRIRAEYEGQIYQARSLNEFRSLLTAYFQAGITKKLEHKELKVEIKDKKGAEVSFAITFHNKNGVWDCEVLLDWLKEKRWFVESINIENCNKI